MHQSSFLKMTDFVSRHLDEPGLGGDALDVGSLNVNGSYKSLFAPERWNYVGLDMQPGENVDVVPSNPYEWTDLADESFDVVISGQALEHCEFFWLTFKEIHRVMKPGALCCIIVPSSGPEHRYPVDCWRFYPDGMKALCKYSGLSCLEAETEWEPKKYEDGSQEWKDTLLIARKDST